MRCWAVALCAVLAGVCSWSRGAAVVLPPHDTIAGKTLQDYAAGWYQYIYSVPQDTNPLLDDTGANASVNQSGPVFYLVGKVDNGSGQPITVERTVTVTDDKFLFFPLININTDNVGASTPSTVEELTAAAKANIDTVDMLHASIDGEQIAEADLFTHREQSPVFSYTLPENNIYAAFGLTVPAGEITPAVADGYWLAVAPLSVGTHDINFGGHNNTATPFSLDVTYHVNVEAAQQPPPTGIPLPAAVWPGMALLGSIPVVRKLRGRT
jgi:hypothetical protein